MAAALGGASHLGARTQQRPGGAGSGRPAPPRALLLLRPRGPLLPALRRPRCANGQGWRALSVVCQGV